MGDKKKLNIIFIPMDFTNQITPGVGLAQKLVDRGHSVTIIVDYMMQSLYKDYKFNIEVIDIDLNQLNKVDKRKESDAVKYHQLFDLFVPKVTWLWDMTMFAARVAMDHVWGYRRMVNKSDQLRPVIDKYKPDLFILEDTMGYASVFETNKPWVWLYDGSPLAIMDDQDLPPPYLGLSAETTDLMTPIYKWLYESVYQNGRKLVNGVLAVSRTPFMYIMDGSPYLNLYAYPLELEYPGDERQVAKRHVYRVDSFVIRDESIAGPALEAIHKWDYNPNKKLVYVSMGAVGTAHIRFMQRLIDTLGRSPHLFIVSKGYFADEYQLADNMIAADAGLPSRRVVEVVDLVVTDGDTTVVTEAFSFGKPVIALPFIMDQLDNAQRVQDMGFGLRLDPWALDGTQLLDAIDQLLGDERLKQRLMTASSRIWAEDRLEKAVKLVEELVH